MTDESQGLILRIGIIHIRDSHDCIPVCDSSLFQKLLNAYAYAYYKLQIPFYGMKPIIIYFHPDLQ